MKGAGGRLGLLSLKQDSCDLWTSIGPSSHRAWLTQPSGLCLLFGIWVGTGQSLSSTEGEGVLLSLPVPSAAGTGPCVQRWLWAVVRVTRCKVLYGRKWDGGSGGSGF